MRAGVALALGVGAVAGLGALARLRSGRGGPSGHSAHSDDAGERRRRVVVATRLYAPEPYAAALRQHGLARALAARGAQVEVLTSTPAGLTAPEDPGVRVRSAPVLRDETGYIRGYVQYMSFDIPLAVRLLCVRRPDLVIAEPPPTTGAVVRVVAALRGIPYAYYAADVWSDAATATGAPGWVVAALRAVERFALSGARYVLTVSDGVAERVSALGARRVEVLPNGIDTEVFIPSGDVDPDAPEGPYFLYAGTASEWQGAGVFVEALRLVHREEPRAELVFLGQGSDWEHLRDLADGDPRVHLVPVVPPARAAAWQRGAVASVVSIRPGLGYDFAYPTKIFAALACGTPVIYAGPGPARAEVQESSLGWATDYDARAVADSMLVAMGQWERERDAGTLLRRSRRLRGWVLEHRSMSVVLGRAAEMLLGGPDGDGDDNGDGAR